MLVGKPGATVKNTHPETNQVLELGDHLCFNGFVYLDLAIIQMHGFCHTKIF